MEQQGVILPMNIEETMKRSYLDYSMSVIVGRALPDIRDGLKPVHRRILYAMFREGLLSNKKHSKSAGVVGEVLKKFHPHGDSAVYDSMVRMAQEWNLRYPLIDGQGNFGSVDGDSAAAYRYTEARLTRIAEEMLADIDKETIDYMPNFDGSHQEPAVLPTQIPNLLINGSSGIAVGMATNIPPHNLNEIVDALNLLIDHPAAGINEILTVLHGPDFPTGGFILGQEGIREAYTTGRGKLTLQARTLVERSQRKGAKDAIVITEIPYGLNKAKLIEDIAHLVQDKKVEGITDIRDESDRDGMRIVLELRKYEVAEVLLNRLFKHTNLRTTFGVIMLALVNNQPRVLTLMEMLRLFLDHRKEVVTRRSLFDLKRAQDRAHILEGFKIVLDNLDAVIRLIRNSSDPEAARFALIKEYALSEAQARAVLDMRLQRLTGMERNKILSELKETYELIKKLQYILAHDEEVLKIIREELKEIRERYGDPRRTEIVAQKSEIKLEDLIAEEDMVITISHSGYIKRNAVSLYRAQRRGGRGVTGMDTKEEDFVERLFVARTHDYLLFFTDGGKVYWLKVHEIPQAGRAARGKAMVNLLQIGSEQKITNTLPVKDFEENKFIIMATKKGIVKKTALSAYSRPRANGITALTLDSGDELIRTAITNNEQDILLGTRDGFAIRFHESQVRSMGRVSRGVKGISLRKGDEVVGMEVVNPAATLLAVAENGYGKRTSVSEYPVQSRGGKGVITIKTTERNGKVVGIWQVTDEDDLMMITRNGQVIRMKVSGVSVIGRNTQGVKLIGIEKNDKVTGIATLAEKEDEEEPAG
ncbi:MAG: DNA gyrase subunit A [Nitrospirae bacterium CG_4_9_14_3_um_filter_53_35]|nr:MAG: DNA gyrase subunit A [Nitrospirae bacterium CG2_30_53_67]PIS37547.1 MAG: DNA gyrase subunit A [Nitrospirae bacterium CG08_land_8_20_14_0_20_52_24]PIV85579.1 MAG: DNA gyrase subunit A [Nitrospirae bacterium CG17_big_fil_post_rev_8_21_14_2_50_50_9]PIW85651.1 MAG: DNA gyrase subunit A [Nitrospirae bacterium CG_4_8_14_3_um_filter_50_41]PIX87043.1 MAG: DNA gyrase subunit A [Nitrospirae bacterium CG_4_10_14_3_um_filter_53_41]PJA77475.1 MAG: DNA gyrase subunit A [Nitrospirae bacterium CG_4_9_